MKSSFVIDAVRASVGEIYLVGGSVRDSIMGLEQSNDYDFATPLEPAEVKKKLESDGYKVID